VVWGVLGAPGVDGPVEGAAGFRGAGLLTCQVYSGV